MSRLFLPSGFISTTGLTKEDLPGSLLDRVRTETRGRRRASETVKAERRRGEVRDGDRGVVEEETDTEKEKT